MASEQADLPGEQVAIVTGGTSGIGRGIAVAFVAAGVRVGLVDVDLPAADAAARALGDRACPIRAHGSRLAEARRMVREAVDAFGPATILFHAAAPAVRAGPALPMDPELGGSDRGDPHRRLSFSPRLRPAGHPACSRSPGTWRWSSTGSP
jgi:NAD(P)-dependent dehydrogenase (short-subunit alcohol dehydrogenase family)